jgi:DNA repair exonuclease SbcCD nuclease subunit
MGKIKFLACGDFHLMSTSPRCRVDDIMKLQDDKIRFIKKTAIKHKADAVIFPGDVFDNNAPPYGLLNWAIDRFLAISKYSRLLFVFGQHDLPYHRANYENTALSVVLRAVPNTYFLTEKPAVIEDGWPSIYGFSWREKLVRDVKFDSMVVIHKTVTPEPLPWESPDLITAEQLFSETKAAVIIAGDNHNCFVSRAKGRDNRERFIFNMGSILRKTKAQKEHKPAMALISYDIETKQYTKDLTIYFPIDNNVFRNDEEAGESNAASIVDDSRLAEFIEEMKNGHNIGKDFIARMVKYGKGQEGFFRSLIMEIVDELERGSNAK